MIVGAGGDAIFEDAIDLFRALAELCGESRVDRGAVDAAVQSGRCSSGELAFGTRGTTGRVEDAAVGRGTLGQDVDIERQETELIQAVRDRLRLKDAADGKRKRRIGV